MFYRDVMPVDPTRHGDLKLGPVTDFSFANTMHALPVVGFEFIDAMRDYPIVFAVDENGAYLPTVMLGMRADENLFVDAEGHWQARYIPLYISRYPFVTSETPDNQAVVCIDEAAIESLKRDDGMPVFEDGKPSERMKQIAQTLFALRDDAKRCAEWSKELADAGLFKQVSASAELPGGENISMDGMFVIDDEKLRKLPKETAYKWFANGLMSLIYAHLFSLRNLDVLVDRLQKKTAA
ncbi:SapC family protein [Chitinimonas lacunae]|uniref:SapC family protein n=1 Tax=Chitinimonas lacunae TaxID=1963018 RepID=A0ABV8MV14_9NEIS